MSWLDQILCPVAQLSDLIGASTIVAIWAGVFAGGLLASTVFRVFRKLLAPGSTSIVPRWLAAVLIALAVYTVALIVDPLLKAVLTRPAGVPAEVWSRIGFFEWKLMGGEWSWPILPLSDHPGPGIVVHVVAWLAVVSVVWALLAWLHRNTRLTWETPQEELPWFYRWVGSSTTRRADARFRKWIRPLLLVLVPFHLLSGFLLATEADARMARANVQCADGDGAGQALPDLTELGLPVGQTPAEGETGALGQAVRERLGGGEIPGGFPPGAWALAGLLLLALSVHLIIDGRPPEEKPEKNKKDEAADAAPAVDPLRRLGDALQSLVPGAFLEALEEHPQSPGEPTEFAQSISPLVREAFSSLAGSDTPWSHQREVLDHLAGVWRMAAPSGPGAAPALIEELGPTPIRSEDPESPHALILCAEGSGRTTLTCVAALYVHLDRGATTLVIARDRDAARLWAKRLRDTLARSSARWNVHVVVAGDDLAEALLSAHTPAVVVAGLEELETDVLASQRTDPFFARLGLIVAEDVDRFTGVAEMHLHMIMRRTWAILDTVHDAAYPVALLAVAGPSASGLEAWARHVLAAPMRIFDRDGAPQTARAVLRRRDLADSKGEAIPLSMVAEACDRAQIPWHRRRAGDAHRQERTAETELGRLRRFHVDDPLDAEVVLLEGTYPDVRREAERLSHAGLRTERRVAVLVLAPPADEEMVLHEEAIDAPNRELIDALPRAVSLSEPDLVRQQHIDRALGREQDVAALRSRFGADLIDDMLGRLEQAGRVRERKVWYFDARADDAASRRLVRTAEEAALGEPLAASCVSDSSERVEVIDRGTSEILRRVDRAVAAAMHPPGSILLHERGRYRVLEHQERVILCEEVTEPHRTTAERATELERPTPSWSPRKLGGSPLNVSLVRAQVRESFHGVRRYAPGPTLVEHRRYERPVRASYVTDVCLIGDAEGHAPLSRAALIPLAAAMRMMLPCYLRGATDLVDVDVVELAGRPCLVVFDRTPGASGFCRFVFETGIAQLLRLTRMVLERLVGPELTRLHRIHDTTVTGELTPSQWRRDEALTWLDVVLDAPQGGDEESDQRERQGRRVEWLTGEGPGDLGRLWVSSTGRTDDLVWTRHRFRSLHALGEHPSGFVHIDMAVERRTIAHAIRRAVAAGASRTVEKITDSQQWIVQHRASLATASVDLVALMDRLRSLSEEHYVDTVLALVAAIPTRHEPISVAERAPLVVLSRRRADRDAKVVLAWAMLPATFNPTVRLAPEGAVLEVTRGGKRAVVDLSGNEIRLHEGDPGAELAMSWDRGGEPEPHGSA